MKYDVYTSSHFRKSFNRLDSRVQDVVCVTIQALRKDYHDTVNHRHKNFEGERKKRTRNIWRTRCRGTQYRLAWEWLKSGDIGLWEVGTHKEIDEFKPENLPSEARAQWELIEDSEAAPIHQQTSEVIPEADADQQTAQHPEPVGSGWLDFLFNELTPAQMDLVRVSATGPVLIRGVAGSGKTVLGLCRAHNISKLRAQAGRDTSILILTFTNALKTALEWSYAHDIIHLPNDLAIATFGDWMVSNLQRAGIDFIPMDENTRKETIRRIRTEVSQSHQGGRAADAMSSSFLTKEIDDVIRGREIRSLAEYKRVKRTGRHRGLGETRRELIWIIYEKYRNELREQNRFDWAELPELVLKHCKPLPKYDVVIVDEAQDLRPNCLSLVEKLIADYSDYRSLTLLGDLAQSIHYSGISWRDAWLPLSGGRTRLLTQNHRNTRQIMDVAMPILEKCRSLGNVRRYHSPASVEKRGDKPLLIRYTNLESAVDYIANEVNTLRQSLGLNYSSFAILSPRTLAKSAMFRALKKNLPDRGIKCRHFRDEDFLSDDEISLITMHSAKGLEFPVVFIIDFAEGTIPFVGRSSASPEEIEERARKLAYVSITRATQRLYIVYPKTNPSSFVHDILDADENTVEILDLQ